MENILLSVENLSVTFHTDGTDHPAVRNISYTLPRGRTLAIVGESGSGKSVSSMAIMGLLPPSPRCTTQGRILYHPTTQVDTSQPVDLLSLSEKQRRFYRGKHISMIFQEPMTSLNPVQRCGQQVMEMLRLHHPCSQTEARQRVLDLFHEVLLPRPEKIFTSYPHEISGGQKQRVMIAMALICHPDILIADEPTTALDVTVQHTIIELLQQLQERYHLSIIFISHDLGVVARIAHRVAVMYRGQIVEEGAVSDVLYHPRHPYTQGLLACRPPIDSRPLHLPTIEDYLSTATPTSSSMESPQQRHTRLQALYAQPPLLQVQNLAVAYPLQKNLFGKTLREYRAVDGVSFSLYPGETLGLVGESGCGKTTLGRTLLRLVNSQSGSITYHGTRLDTLTPAAMRRLRPQLQMVFQDPYSSLNPRLTVGEAVMEPLRVYRRQLSAAECRRMAMDMLQQVGLDVQCFHRYPHEFSGGQRQRVCIARALILSPEIVICDESVSALDVSVQAQVLNLLNDLKRQHHFTYLFISHDLSVVRFLSDRILVMEQGRIVESGDADELCQHPREPYTQQLIAAIPTL